MVSCLTILEIEKIKKKDREREYERGRYLISKEFMCHSQCQNEKKFGQYLYKSPLTETRGDKILSLKTSKIYLLLCSP